MIDSFVRMLQPIWISTIILVILSNVHAGMDQIQLQQTGRILEGVITERDDRMIISTLSGDILLIPTMVKEVTRVERIEAQVSLADAQLSAGRAEDASRTFVSITRTPAWSSKLSDLQNRIDKQLKPPPVLAYETGLGTALKLISSDSGWGTKIKQIASSTQDWGEQRDRLHLILAERAIDRFDYNKAKHHLNAIDERSPVAHEAQELWMEIPGKITIRRNTGSREIPLSAVASTPALPSPLMGVEGLVAGWPTPARVSQDLIALVLQTAREYGVSEALALAVVESESAWNPKAMSPKGAQGLMQLMPDTAEELGVEDRLNPEQNVRGGVSYLSALLQLYGDDERALAAYNAGPGAVDKAKGIPPYPETQAYVKKAKALRDLFQPLIAQSVP